VTELADPHRRGRGTGLDPGCGSRALLVVHPKPHHHPPGARPGRHDLRHLRQHILV